MRPLPISIHALSLFVLLTVQVDPAFAVPPEPPTPSVDAAAEPAAELAPSPRPQSALGKAIDALLSGEAADLVALEAELATASDPEAALAVQRLIEQRKAVTELSILRTQAAFARAEGRVADAVAIEAALEQMTRPPAAVSPQQRAAAAPTQERR